MLQHTLAKQNLTNNMQQWMLFHLSDFSDMCSTQDSDVTPAEKTVKEDIEYLESQRESTRRLSAFAEQDLVLKIENTKLHVSKDQLMKESAVFDRMLTSDFKEKDKKEIELDGKNLNDFVDFLRCTMPGFDEDVNGNITKCYFFVFFSFLKHSFHFT